MENLNFMILYKIQLKVTGKEGNKVTGQTFQIYGGHLMNDSQERNYIFNYYIYFIYMYNIFYLSTN